MFIKLNDLVVNDHVVIPVVGRPGVAAVNNKLVADLSGWDNNTWDLANWYREACDAAVDGAGRACSHPLHASCRIAGASGGRDGFDTGMGGIHGRT